MNNLRFTEAINRERLTYAEFAEELEVTVRTVHNWATGASAPRLKHARAMEEKFGWDVHRIWPEFFFPKRQKLNQVPNELSHEIKGLAQDVKQWGVVERQR
ncbi:MAG: helix-turn-helix domain-containing protein [Ferrimicrobium sp.]